MCDCDSEKVSVLFMFDVDVIDMYGRLLIKWKISIVSEENGMCFFSV